VPHIATTTAAVEVATGFCSPALLNHSVRHVAVVFAAGAGWPRNRRIRLAEVIVRHMWRAVKVDDDPEGHLVELATGVDITGHRIDEYPTSLRAAALDR
jgi:hypothetical protein